MGVVNLAEAYGEKAQSRAGFETMRDTMLARFAPLREKTRGFDPAREHLLGTSGTVTTLAGCFNLVGQADGTGADARFDLLTTVTVAGDGTLYVTDGWADTIRRITPQGVVDTVVGVPYQASNVPGPLPALLSAPSGIALDPSTGTLAISLRDAILKANF